QRAEVAPIQSLDVAAELEQEGAREQGPREQHSASSHRDRDQRQPSPAFPIHHRPPPDSTAGLRVPPLGRPTPRRPPGSPCRCRSPSGADARRSEEHTSELQSLTNLVCCLLLEK